MKKKLHALLQSTLQDCFRRGLLIETPIPDYIIEVPNNPDHGHFASNLPLTLAASQKRNPREIASILLDNLSDRDSLLAAVEPAGPGFINFTIRSEKWLRVLEEILESGADYGKSKLGADQKVLVEYVSANPTGPLHLGHGRGAALGDTLCRILSFCGYQVVREFYINDAGEQIRMLGESVYARIKQLGDPDHPFPENGYRGDYVTELAEIISGKIDLDALPKEKVVAQCAEKGKEIMLEDIKGDLARFRVGFDVWFSESDLYDSGLIDRTLETARASEHLYENEGALWIGTSSFGDDKDRVIRKKNGQYTYFASDIAYHLQKHSRGFDRAINIWGADHHGYVPRIRAALSAQGISEDWLSVLLIQLVKLWKGGGEIKMSKRAGNFVTLRDLVDEVGVDAVRFVFLTKSHDSPLDFDIDLVKKQDSDNPVYYVQYAHARICSIFRKARSEGASLTVQPDGLLDRLVLGDEVALIRRMAEFPYLLEDVCRTLEPHRLTYYLTDLAASFHRYFNLGTKIPEHRILAGDPQLTQARLSLARGVKTVIANGLALMGIHAPERM